MISVRPPATSAANIGRLNFTCLFQRAKIQVNKYKSGKLSTKAEFFPRGIYSKIHSPIITPEIICVMALTLQPIRGCPQHSRETGTRLSSEIHRRLFSRFSLREGGRLYTGYLTPPSNESLEPLAHSRLCSVAFCTQFHKNSTDYINTPQNSKYLFSLP